MSSNAGWIIWALVAIFGVAILGRRRAGRPSRERQPPRPELAPLKPGEKYDTTVKLVTLPNVPLAELWCQRLKEHGIESFYKGGSPLAGIYGTELNQNQPAELWVGEHDAERAQELLRELS